MSMTFDPDLKFSHSTGKPAEISMVRYMLGYLMQISMGKKVNI